MATVSFVSPADQLTDINELVKRFTPEGDSSCQSISSLISEEKLEEALGLALDQQQHLFSSPMGEKDIEAFFNNVLTLLTSLEGKDGENFKKMLNGVTAGTDKALVRMKILGNLFNLYDESAKARRAEIFTELLKFATKAEKISVLEPQLEHLETWSAKWGLTQEEETNLRLLAYKGLITRGPNRAALNQLLRYFKGCNDITTCKNYAAEAVILAIKTKDTLCFDHLLELPVIAQLKDDTSFSNHYALLSIFTSGGIAEFKAFAEQHPGFFKEAGVDQEECSKKIKLLSLASLTNNKESVPLSEIATSLQVEQGEVERWLITAVSAGLVEGKIDQLASVFRVNSTTKRTFTSEDWKGLKDQVSAWRESLTKIRENVEANMTH